MSKKLLSLLLVIAMLMSVVSVGFGAITASAAAVGSGAEQGVYKVFRLSDNNTSVVGTTYSSTIKVWSSDANYKIKVNTIEAYMPYATSGSASVSYTTGAICTSSGVDFGVSGSISADEASPIRYTCNYDIQDLNGNTIYKNLTGYGYGYASGKAEQSGAVGAYPDAGKTGSDITFRRFDENHYFNWQNTLNTCYVNSFDATRKVSCHTAATHTDKGDKWPVLRVGTLPPTATLSNWHYNGYTSKSWDGEYTWWTMTTPTSGFWSFTLEGPDKNSTDNGGFMSSKIYYMVATDKTNALNSLNTYLGNCYQKEIYTQATWNNYLEKLDQAAAAGRSVSNDTYGYQIGCTYAISAGSNLSTASSGLTKAAVTYDTHKDAETISNPTCTETGLVRHYSISGETYDETTPALGHQASGTWVVTQEATCTQTGTRVQYCTRCGQVAVSETIPLVAHELGEWEVQTQATCTTNGLKVQKCTKCGTILNTEVIPAIGHQWNTWVVTLAPTCTTEGSKTRTCKVAGCGATETQAIPALGHNWSEEWVVTKQPTCYEVGKETRTCIECGAIETRDIPMIDHTWGDWVVTTPATCTTPGEETRACTASDCTATETREIPATGHTPGEWTVDTPATCTTAGSQVKRCTVCNVIVDSAVIPALGHDYVAVVTPPTCTEQGYTTYTCSRCHDSYVADYTDALGHTWGEWEVTTPATCTTTGVETRTCLVDGCGATETREIPALGHDYVAVVTEPTCTEQGYTTYTCSRCHDSYVADYTDALGHTWGDWEITTPATCTTTGVETRTCSECGATETREIPLAAHTPGDWEVVTEATCTTNGQQVKKCTVCGEILESAVIPALGHDYVAVVTPPLPGVQGYTTYTCSRCGDSYISDYVPALPVDPVANTVAQANEWLVQNGLDVIVNGTYADINSDNLADTVGINVNVDGFWTSDTGFQFQLDGLSNKIKTFLQENYADISSIKLDGVEVYKDGKIQSAAIKDVIFNVGGGAFTKLANLGADGVYYQGVISFVENGVERTVDLSITLAGEHLAAIKSMAAKAEDNISVFEEGDATVAEVIAPKAFVDYFVDYAGQYDLLKDQTAEQFFGKFSIKNCLYLLSNIEGFAGEDSSVSGALNTIATVLANNPDLINKIMGRVVSATVDVNGQEVPLLNGSLFIPDGTTFESVVLKIRNMLSEEILNTTISQFKIADKYGWIEIPVTVVINSGENVVSTNRIEEKLVLRANLFDVENCQHQYVITKETPATCTTDGLKTVTCAVCGDVISETVIPALGHTAGDWEVVTQPTCTTDGSQVKRCTVCNEILETAVIPALGHDWSDWTVTTKATCTTDGVETRTCLRDGCGETETRAIPATGHNYVAVVTAPTCTEQGYTTYTCSYCNDFYVADYTDALGHDWSEWVVTTAATYDSKGIETRTCLRVGCGETETREIPMLEHNWGPWVVTKSPTRLDFGSETRTDLNDVSQKETRTIEKFDILDALSLTRCTGTYIATDEGATVTVNSNPNANPNIAVGPAKDHTLTMDRGTGPILGLVSGGRYTFNPINAAKVGDRFETTMTVDGYPYKIVWIYNRIPFTIDQLKVLYANYENGVTLDSATKTITINSKIGGTSVDIYNVSNTLNAFTFEIPEDGNVDLYTTYRYKVTKPENADQVTTTFTVKSINPTEVYTLIVNFIPAPFNPSAYIAPVSGGVELKTINGVESILISKDPTKKYVGIKTAGLQGATLAIAEVPGMQLITSGSGYTYYKIYPTADEADVPTSITITMATGKVVTYPLIFRFKAAEFTPSVLDAVNLDIAKSTYNNVANTMTLVSTTDSYVRIYKKTISGLTLSINAADYPFMTEYTNFYQIDKKKLSFADCGIARFNVYIADEDRTIATSVAFPGSGTLSTEFFTSSNATFTVSGNVITIKIGADKSNALLYRNLTNASAERLSMTYDTGTTYIADLTATNDSYKIYKAAAGMDITITISGVTYTLVVTS